MSEKKTNSNKNTKNGSGKRLSGRNVLMVRILAGVYLLYLSYSMIGGLTSPEVTHKYVMAAFIAAFVVIGGCLVLFSGKSLMQGYYIGGEMDVDEETKDQMNQNTAETVKKLGKAESEEKGNLTE